MANDEQQIAEALRTAKRIAVVGLSPKVEKASHGVAVYLQDQGYEVIPVNPVYDQILGVPSYPSVAAIPGGVDIVDVFRRPEDVPPVVDDVLQAPPRYLWLQLGIRNDDAAARAETAGVTVFQDLCIKVVHSRLKTAGKL